MQERITIESSISKNKSRSDGLQCWCKSCRNELDKTRVRQPERENTKKKRDSR